MFLGYRAAGSLIHCWLGSIWKNWKSIYPLTWQFPSKTLFSLYIYLCLHLEQHCLWWQKNWKQWRGQSKGDWLNKWKHSHPIEWNVAGGKKGQIDMYWCEKSPEYTDKWKKTKQNMVESHNLKEGGGYTEYFWKDIQENSNSVPSEV